MNQQRPNLRASYNTGGGNTFYPEIGIPITSDGRKNIPQNGSYLEGPGIKYANQVNNSGRIQFKKF
jgi:hypothetical protein